MRKPCPDFLFTMILLLSTILSFGHSAAMADDDKDDFNNGLSAFQQKNYHAALQHFRNARSNGVNSSQLNYNLAVSYYRTGNYQQAFSHFDIAAQDPRIKALSYYNLGLTSLRLEQPGQAHYWLLQAKQHSTDDKLTQLADQTLKSNLHPKTSATPLWQWSLSLRSDVGYDDNVAIYHYGGYIPGIKTQDEYFAFNLSQQALLGKHFYIRNHLNWQDYTDKNQFDNINGNLEVGLKFNSRKLEQHISTNSGRSTLADKILQDSYGITYMASLSVPILSKIDFTQRMTLISARDSHYAHLQGNYSLSELALNPHIGRDPLQLYFRYENHHRKNLQSKNNLSESFSPVIMTTGMARNMRLIKKISLKGFAEIAWSDYQTLNIVNNISDYRKDRAIRFGANSIYPYSRKIQLISEVRYYFYSSNFKQYWFTNTQVSSGVIWNL